LTSGLAQLGRRETVTEFLVELEGVSAKVVREAVSALPDLERRVGLELVVPWLDLAIAPALSSGATAIRYLRESPLLLGLLPTESRLPVLRAAQDMAEQDANVALEMVRNAPELLRVVPAADLGAWGGLGEELARVDYVVAVEFLRQSPAVVGLLPWESLRAWVRFGMGLLTQNSLGKPDYLATLEFFRRSPAILGDIEGAPLRAATIDLGALLTTGSPQQAVAWMAEAPRLLRAIPDASWRRRVMQYGGLVAERDAEAALAYFRRVPEILNLLGEGADLQARFDDWFKGAMEVMGYSVEGARAYFAMETRKALASLEQALNGVALRQVARHLKLFAQALCGTDVALQALPGSVGSEAEPIRASVSADGRTILLPSIIRRAPTYEANLRLYTVMTAHEAGHLEYGTYRISLGRLADLMDVVRRRYGRALQAPMATLSDLFQLYPQPLLVRDLWTLVEDARVEHRLRSEYPGLGQDLAQLAKDAVTVRTLNHGLTVRELVADCLLLLTTTDPATVAIPEAVREIVMRLWAECQPIFRDDATAEEALRLADRLYVQLEAMTSTAPAQAGQAESDAQTPTAGPQASESLTDQYRPLTNWSHRGVMDASLIADQPVNGSSSGSHDQAGNSGDLAAAGGAGDRPGRRREANVQGLEQGGRDGASEAQPNSLSERLLALEDARQAVHASDAPGERIWTYDEWDGQIQDYRTDWCRVIERVAVEHAMDFADEVLMRQGAAAVRTLRRSFERMKPPGLRTVRGASDGDSLDWDAVVRRRADLAAGAEPTDEVYVRREKRERDVAVAFLVDLSGSTSRRLEGEGRRVIDVEKEGLVLLCEALDALGDQYAVYGYSGQGRSRVDFLVFKEFDEAGRGRATARLGAASPLHQNRDGAAIRHAARKLLARSAKNKVLMLISDGRPLDDGYADEYSLEDTKIALREARMKGIHPFCITVDQAADAYVKRMYGDVHSLVVDNARELPERLPRVYQRLTT
jgi:hypothetical protein